nr:hypothetical protein [Tanacetum cinerariifolium]
MNYLEEQIDDEAMINSIHNGDQPLPVIAPVSLARTAQNAPPTLKDPKFWTAEEKKTRKIDRLARSLLIQGLLNDIYSLFDSNETAKDLWDALERQMCGSEYGEQDRKAVILYEYETFKATEGEQLLDTYLRYLQKQYGTLMRQTKNLMDINIDALYNILKQNQSDVNDALGYKKKAIVVTSDLLALLAEKAKVSKRKEKVVVSLNSKGSGADDISELKKITALLAKAFNRRNFYSKLTNNNLRTSSTSQSTNKKQEFVKSNDKKEDKKADDKKRDMSKVLSESDESSSSAEETIAENADLLAQTDVLQDQFKVKHVVIDTHTECQAQYAKLEDERYEYMIRYSALCDNDKQHRKKIDEQEILFDKMSRQVVEMNNNVLRLQEKILEKETKISELEGCVSNRDVEIEKCLERLNECFENPNYFEKAKDLRPSIYDEEVIGLGRSCESFKKEKANLKTIESLKSKGFESSENALYESENQSENDCYVVEKECDNVENLKVIAPGMFKLSVSQSVSPILMSKTSCDSKNVENKASEVIISFIKKTQVNLQLQVQRVRTDNGTEFKNKTLAKFFDEIMKSSTTNVKTLINEEVFHEVSESFQGESFSPSLNDDVQQSLEEDHPLHKIIGDPKSSVRTRGQLANSCLFSCLLSSIEPANIAEALKDADWVNAMQDELDQFARLKV